MDPEYKYRVTIEVDQDVEQPFEPFTVYSFNRHHSNYKHPDDIDRNEPGLYLSYHEHGNARWFLFDGTSVPHIDHWDTVAVAGWMHVNGHALDWWNGMDTADQQKAADSFLEEYTHWWNGDGFYYAIEEVSHFECDFGALHDTSKTLDSCGGFLGFDHILEAVREALPDDATKKNTEVISPVFDSWNVF